MNEQSVGTATISEALIESVCARLAENQRVRRTLPGGGRLSIDRQLPFLIVYRQPPGRDDSGTAQLVSGEAAFLIAHGDPAYHRGLAALVRKIAETTAARFDAFLLVEVWSCGDDETAHHLLDAATDEPLVLKPYIRVVTRPPLAPETFIERLSESLQRIQVHRQPCEVEIDHEATTHPPGMRPLVPASRARAIRCHFVGLEVRPVYRDCRSGVVFPRVLRVLRRSLGRALKRTCFAFAHEHTNVRPVHYHVLGRRTLEKIVLEVDRRLAEVSDAFDFLLQVTPINVQAAWVEFKRYRFERPPAFHYRPLPIDPALLKRKLFAAPIEEIEDPTLAELFRQKQDEMDRKITMLGDVGTPRFLPGSLQVYGEVEPALLEAAGELLRRIPSRSREDSRGRQVDAHAFAERALREIERYREMYPDFAATVVVRDDLYSGLLVSRGDLLIGSNARFPASRVEPLLHHEIGTHSVTWYNGRAQPMQLLHSGLAGYDGLQEGLAVLAEYLAGGLSRPRLRLLAARVVAAHQVIAGASFIDTFRLLEREHGFARRVAWTITMRIYRGGGLTKDVVYLRGLVEVLDYLRGGRPLEPLLVGKMALDHVPIIEELLHRQVLRPPQLRPRYLDNPPARDKLTRLAQGVTVLDLIEGKSR